MGNIWNVLAAINLRRARFNKLLSLDVTLSRLPAQTQSACCERAAEVTVHFWLLEQEKKRLTVKDRHLADV